MQSGSFFRFLSATAVALALCAACDRSGSGDSDADTVDGLTPGLWRATATVPGGELPFELLIEEGDDVPVVHLVNATERVRVREVSSDGTRWRFRLPAFNSTIEATLEENRLRGTLTLVKRNAVEQVMPFVAVPVATDEPAEREPPAVDLTGRWEASFYPDEGGSSRAIGEFTQSGAELSGTFLTPTGDYRYLAGYVEGRNFLLSCFDGGHAFLFKGTVAGEGRIEGDFWSGTAWHEAWTADRNESAELPDPLSLTALRDGVERFVFDFPDVDGTTVTSDDPRFRGKVVIAVIGGSWCPNCHDAAAVISQLYQSHHAAGLEAVGLMYEHYPDFDRAALQVKRFAEKYHVGYPLLVAGYSNKSDASRTLPGLTGIKAYPTIIVIDREGLVRRIYTGFTGPGTGRHYKEFVRSFTGFVEALLDSR